MTSHLIVGPRASLRKKAQGFKNHLFGMLRKARCAGSLKKLLGTPEGTRQTKKTVETYIKGGVDKKGDNPTKTKGRFIVIVIHFTVFEVLYLH